LAEVRQQYGGPGVSDDDLLLRYFAGKDEVDAMRAAGTSRRYTGATNPVIGLIEELSKASRYNYIQVKKGALSLTLKRAAGRHG